MDGSHPAPISGAFLTPDAATALAFLEWAFAGSDAAALIEIAFSDDDGGAIRRARLFPNTPEGRADAASFAAQVNARPGVNVYVAPALRLASAARDKRSSRRDFASCALVWADFDEAGASAKGRERWREVGLPPHRVVVTGRTPSIRAQAFWRLVEPFADPAALDSALAGVHVGLAFLADPKVLNVDRVMRLPGMVAWPKPGKEGRVAELTELSTPQGARPAPIDLAEFHAAFPPRDAMAARKNQDAAPCDLFAAPAAPAAPVAAEARVSTPATPLPPAPTSAPPAQERAFDMLGRRIDGRDEYAMSVIGGAIRGLAARLGRWPTAEELATEAWPTYERNVGPKNPTRTLEDEGRGPTWFLEKCETHARRAAAGQIRGLETVEKARAAEDARAMQRAAGLTPNSAAPAPFRIAAPAFQPRPSSEIPPRRWLYGRHMIGGYGSVTIAPGGVGKSSLTIVEALAMATGRALLGVTPVRPLRVFLWNGEDPLDEIERRVAAALAHFRIGADEIGDRLRLLSGRTLPIVVAEMDAHGRAAINEDVVAELTRFISEERIDVLVLDPFVSVHRLSENDNGAIDLVMKRAFSAIAESTGCAVELVHHSRKPGAGVSHETAVDDARGASALLAAARVGRVLNGMTAKEAERLGVDPDERWRFFRVDTGKANMSPPAERATWRRMESVALDNGDEVGVATPWTPPDPFEGVSARMAREVRAAFFKADREAGEARADEQADDAWAGWIIADTLHLDRADPATKGRCARLLATWIKSDVLRRVSVKHPKRANRTVPCIEPGDTIPGDCDE